MQTKKVNEARADLRYIRIRKAGNVLDVKRYERMNGQMPITRLDADSYLVNSTGEIKQYDKAKDRSEGVWRIRKSMDNLRAILNANFTGNINEAWSTLTYRENMTDPQQLRKDREKFWKRLRYHNPDIPLEYVAIAEPQERGAWHLHECWKRTDGQKLYIPQKEVLELWGHGGVNIKRLDKSDNIGAYLTAYLQNIPVENSIGKAFVKGARLQMYPPDMNFYRCSRGIVIPEWSNILDEKTEAIIRKGTPNYRQIIEVYDDNSDRLQTVQTEQYNLKRV